MPENKNQNINSNTSSSNQSTASGSGTSSTAKGKGKEVINVVESLDLVIQNAEQLSVNISSESQADLNSEIEKNKIFWMNPNERQELAKKFSGLDKVLYERFEKKARMDKIDRILNYVFLGIRWEETKYFSVDEIKEIANELGVSANVDNLEKLKQIREVINDRETGLLDQITDLQQKINDYEAAKAEAQRRAVEKVKKGRTVDSKAITELKQAKDHISELENEILELEQNRDDFSDLLKAEGIEHASTKRKLENATKAAETLDTRLKTARAEKTEWEKKAKTAERNLSDKDSTIRILREEKAEREGGKLYQLTVWIGKKTGISDLWNAVSNIAMIIGLLVILFGVSWLWKNLVRPIIKNFTPEPKPKKEPEPTPTPAINHNQPPIIILPPQFQTPPTPLPPQEIKAIEVEAPKPIVEKVREIFPNPEKFSPANPDEQKLAKENFPSTPKKNEKKSKAGKKKPKNKK